MDAAAAARVAGHGSRRASPARRLLGPRRAPRALLALGAVVGLASALPALYLAVTVLGDAHAAVDAVLTERTVALAVRSLGLAAAVAAAAVAVAVPLAWLTVRSDLPGRRARRRAP